MNTKAVTKRKSKKGVVVAFERAYGNKDVGLFAIDTLFDQSKRGILRARVGKQSIEAKVPFKVESPEGVFFIRLAVLDGAFEAFYGLGASITFTWEEVFSHESNAKIK